MAQDELNEGELREEVEVQPEDLSGDYAEDQNEEYANAAEPSQVGLSRIIAIIIKTIIGAHIVLIPYMAAKVGYIAFPLLLFAIIGIHHFTSVLLLKCKNICRHSNFSTILYSIWHHFASKLFGATLMMFNNLAFCILQFVLIKTTLVYIVSQFIYIEQDRMQNYFPVNTIYKQMFYCEDQVLRTCWYTKRGFFFVAVMGAIQLPFIFVRKIQKLRIFSIIGVIGIFAYILAVVAYWIQFTAMGAKKGKLDSRWSPFFTDNGEQLSTTASLIILALNFHMNFFPIYKGLKHPTDSRMRKASWIGLTSCAVIYTIVGLLGYNLIGNKDLTQSNFLRLVRYRLYFDHKASIDNPIFFWLLNISYLTSILFNVVLMFFTCKTNLINIVNIIRKQVRRRRKRKQQQEKQPLNQSSSIQDTDQKMSNTSSNKSIRQKNIRRQLNICTIVLYCVFLVCSMFLDQLQYIFSFLGAICSTTMVSLLPCIFYVMLIYKRKQPRRPIFYCAFVLGYLTIPFILFAAFSTIKTVKPDT